MRFARANKKVRNITVKQLLTDAPDVMPYYPAALAVKRDIDLKYGKEQITREVTAGIMQGKSIDGIADGLMNRIDTMNRVSAVRAARTGMTAAQNGGRLASYDAAEKMGIKLKKEWMATLDAKTRDSHATLYGEVVEKDKPFSNGLRYPGDPSGRPAEVYNCRCTMVAALDGYKYAKTYTAPNGEQAEYRSYKEWQAGKLAQGNVYVVNSAGMSYNTDINVRYNIGKPITESEKTLEQALNPVQYALDIAQKYKINLSANKQKISIEIDYDLAAEGKSKRDKPTIIYLGKNAFASEELIATTIAHELNHARSWLKGENAPERTAIQAADRLREYIRGER